jgi:hypothetical protein
MKDSRKTDRRIKNKKTAVDRRKGPRRLVCGCGGKVEAVVGKKGVELFICMRCGKKL